jgi:hypothetical protein
VGAEFAQRARKAARSRIGGSSESARDNPFFDRAQPVQVRFLLSMQETAGNRAVTGLVKGHCGGPGCQQTVQRKKVSDDHVADDLNHPQAERLFSEETMDWWADLPAKDKKNPEARTASVAAGRDQIDYTQLRNTTLKSAQGLFRWLGTDAYEYMYVHCDGDIYTGGRDREKLPHPTLVGGDPDATCAGTMLLDNSKKTVTITNESGHFRPSSVASDTVEYVKSILPKRGHGKAGWKVKRREV